MAQGKLKVVQVLPALNGGGVERGTLEVAEALVLAGHDSVVVSAGGRMVAELEAGGSRHVKWDLGKKSPLTLLKILSVRQWLRKEQPDVLHLRSRMPAWIMWLAWRSLPVGQRPRLVTTVHGLYSVSWYSRIMCRGERVIAVSKTVENYIFKNYPQIDRDKVRLIFRGVDTDVFSEQYRPSVSWIDAWYESFPALKGVTVITLPGRLTRLKGHHQFIELMAKLTEQGMDVIGLVVGGEDPKRRAYALEIYEKVKKLGLTDRVVFAGHRSDIKEIYAMSDIILSLSSKPESFGRTVLEALSMGKPVVGNDHGGVGEVLSELFAEGRVPVGDKMKLEVAVRNCINKKLEPKSNTSFIKSEMLAKTLAIYEELCVE